jgi:hypothetical protein
MFRWKLNKRTKRVAQEYVRGSVRKQLTKEDHIKKWVSGEGNFDKQKYLSVWEDYRREYGDKILVEVLKAMAISNSVVDVNHILQYNMAMPQAVIETGPVYSLLAKTFNLNLANLLLEDSGLDEKTKQETLARVVAREFPLKSERTPVIPQAPAQPERPLLPTNTRTIKRGE